MSLRRAIVLNGDSETWQYPDWYVHVQAARYLNISPVELMQQPYYWKQKALMALTAENQARDILENKGK